MLMFPRHLEGGDGGAGEGSEDGDHSLRVNPRGEEQGRKGRGSLDQRRRGVGPGKGAFEGERTTA